MNTDQFVVWFLGMLNIPFIALLGMAWIITDALRLAHRGGKLDMANMFKDENGKESSLRVVLLGAWAISSWVVMADQVTNKNVSIPLIGLYLLTWSGSPALITVVNKWNGSFKQ